MRPVTARGSRGQLSPEAGLTSAKWKGVFLSSLQPQTLGSPIHTTAPLPALGRLVTHRQHDPCKMTTQGHPERLEHS